MTNFGLYSNLHQQMREIAELVDRVLISLRTVDTHDRNKESLADVLDHLVEPNPEELTDLLLSITLQSDRADQNRWKRLSKALRTSNPDTTVISDLEKFAQLLEQKQADALAKMRGWTH